MSGILKLYIVEDNPIQREEILGIMSTIPFVEVVGTATNGEDFISDMVKFHNQNIEVTAVVLDMNLGDGRTGLDSYLRLSFKGISKLPLAIMVTGSDELKSADTSELNILDVVSKPYTKGRILEALEKAKYKHEFDIFRQNKGIFVPVYNDECKLIPPSDILYIETDKTSNGKKCLIFSEHSTGCPVYNSSISYKAYVKLLGPLLFRECNRSCLVNLEKVTDVILPRDKSEEGYVLFHNDVKTPLYFDEQRMNEFHKYWTFYKSK